MWAEVTYKMQLHLYIGSSVGESDINPLKSNFEVDKIPMISIMFRC